MLFRSGELSSRQDLALAKWNLHDIVDIRLETSNEENLDGSRRLLDEKHPIFTGGQPTRESEVELRGFQHHELLYRALSTAKDHLKIVTTQVSAAVVDEHFCRLIDIGLKRRVRIDIAHAADPEMAHDPGAVTRLQELQKRHKNLSVRHVAGACEETLVFDGWKVTGNFPWLGHRTYPHQTLRSYTGTLSASGRSE